MNRNRRKGLWRSLKEGHTGGGVGCIDNCCTFHCWRRDPKPLRPVMRAARVRASRVPNPLTFGRCMIYLQRRPYIYNGLVFNIISQPGRVRLDMGPVASKQEATDLESGRLEVLWQAAEEKVRDVRVRQTTSRDAWWTDAWARRRGFDGAAQGGVFLVCVPSPSASNGGNIPRYIPTAGLKNSADTYRDPERVIPGFRGPPSRSTRTRSSREGASEEHVVGVHRIFRGSPVDGTDGVSGCRFQFTALRKYSTIVLFPGIFIPRLG